MREILLSLSPIFLISILVIPIFTLLVRRLSGKITIPLIFFTSLLISPFLLGITLYLLFYLLPERSNYFYLTFLSVEIFILYLTQLKHLGSTWRVFVDEAREGGNSERRTFIDWALIILILVIVLLVFLRAIFWPVNWDDQILYIEQSYAIGQARSLQDFIQWNTFNNGVLKYAMNPGIRPGLPMIFALTFLFGTSLKVAFIYAQVVMFGFFLILLGIIFYTALRIASVNRLRTGLITVFFLLSTFLFVSHSIYGFKELIVISLTLLALNLLDGLNKESQRKTQMVLLGVLTGLISFMNYSGTVIALVLLFLAFLFLKEKISQKLLFTLGALMIAFLVSCGEMWIFGQWVINGLSGNNAVSVFSTASTEATSAATATNTLSTAASTSADYELNSYKINGFLDIFTKGKLQGLFQFQFYGFIFLIFLITLIFNFKSLKQNTLIKRILAFCLFYAFIFFDPLGLNHHQYAYVLTVSHKYTVMLVPFIAIILGTKWEWLANQVNRITPKILAVILTIFLALDLALIRSHYDWCLNLINLVIPIHRDYDYYLRYLKLGDLIIRYSALGLLLGILLYLFWNKKEGEKLWQKSSFTFVLFILFVFFLPFTFFFNTNFGLADTLLRSGAAKEVKLTKIRGWENQYGMVNEINALPHGTKILFLGQSWELLAPHLTIPLSSVKFRGDLLLNADESNLEERIRANGVEYIFVKEGIKINEAEIEKLSYLKTVVNYGPEYLLKVK